MKLRLPHIWFGISGAMMMVGGALLVLLVLAWATITTCSSTGVAACLGWSIGLVGWIVILLAVGVLALGDLSRP